MPSKTEVCGIIVTYNPNNSMLFAIERNCLMFSKIIIYDNSTDNESALKIENLVNKVNLKFDSANKKVILQQDLRNVGLSKAYNRSASIAKKLGFKYILILDQDSFFESDSLNILFKDWDLLEPFVPIGAMSPSYVQSDRRFYDFLFNGKFEWRGFYYSNRVVELRDLINSGMLISLNVFESVGKYDERIFLDNSDRNLTLRLRLNGYRLFRSKQSKLVHNYGEKLSLKSRFHIYSRSPERDFYIKDLIDCIPIARKISFIDFCLLLFLVLSKIFSTLMLKDEKNQRLYYILNGIKYSHIFKKTYL